MGWRCKAFGHSVLSRLPLSGCLFYGVQRYITRSLPDSPAKTRERIGAFKRHIELVESLVTLRIGSMSFYEFGAGHDLLGPMTYYACGVNRQVVIDRNSLLRVALLNNGIQQLSMPCAGLVRPPKATVGPDSTNGRESLRELYGIEYIAPCDARATPLEPGVIDCITSTNTLEHIPQGDLRRILAECYRVLRPGGVVSFKIDYQDHFSYSDTSVSAYNFLQYSDSAWRKWSPPNHYQNRLRHSDYRELISITGFEVVAEEVQEPSEADLRLLGRLRLATRFGSYHLNDLATRGAYLIARKPVQACAE
jgi:SAM-dependent methyltransferase